MLISATSQALWRQLEENVACKTEMKSCQGIYDRGRISTLLFVGEPELDFGICRRQMFGDNYEISRVNPWTVNKGKNCEYGKTHLQISLISIKNWQLTDASR
jgi:hypothetical protein